MIDGSGAAFRVCEAADASLAADEAARFYAEHWARRIALALPEFYDWQFRRPPRAEGRDRCVVCTRDDSLLGVMGANPRRFHLAGASQPGAELTTWVVDKAARGMGVGRGILAFLQRRYDVLAGMGITDDALPLYLQGGFVHLKGIPRMVRIYDAAAARPYAKITELGTRLIAQFARQQSVPYQAELLTGDAVDRCETAWRDAGYHFFERNRETLAWRYEQHPVFRYDRRLVRGGGRGISVVTRLDEIDGFRILHVMDVFGDEADIPAALSFIEDRARDLKIAAADFYCTADRVTRHFRRRGWFSTLDDDHVQLMHLYHPPELRSPPTTTLVYWSRNHLDDMMETSRLYVTKQDLDLDRPTAATFERAAATATPQ